MALRLAVFVALLVVACGDETERPVDSGADANADAAVPLVDIPWLEDGQPPVARPVFTPCPDGWREVVDGDLTTCDAFPEGGHETTCGPGEAHFPGEPGCVPVGNPCPAGDFAEGLPVADVVYVRAGATAGDGSLSAPFGLLSEVPWVSLAAGTTVALGKGTYEGSLPLKAGVRVAGACAAETILTGIDAPVRSVVMVTTGGEPARIENLTIRDAPQAAVGLDTAGRDLAVSGIVVDGCSGPGVWSANGASLTGDHVVIRNSRPSTDGRAAGLYIYAAGQAALRNVSIEHNGGMGVAALGEGTVVSLEDAVITGTTSMSDDSGGWGVIAQSGPSLTLRRAVVYDNRSAGIMAAAGPTVTLDHVIVRANTGTPRTGFGGRGIELHPGGTLVATRVLVEDNLDTGIALGGDATLSDVVVRGTRSSPLDADYGTGMNIEAGAQVQMDRAVVADNQVIGIYISDGGTEAFLRDVIVRDMLPTTDDSSMGRGFNIQQGAHFDGERILIERTRDSAFFVSSPGTIARVSDIAVLSTASRQNDGTGGSGLHVQRMGQMSVSRALVRSSHWAGAIAMDFAVSTLEDVWIDGVEAQECSTTTCADRPFGYGIASVGTTTVRGFHVEGASLCGVFVARVDEGNLDLERGEVTGAAIGACVQIDGYDLGRLMNDVEYRENGVNLDTTALPVPDPI
ncbi:MAG: right-handed parallel beta-helix repeat-containing protein [Deltaproteobacteria bacterium]|nr:right-handed parallel beta-helix repeat-containing protein [Deltaproteobacteria bacterium]